MNEAKLLPGSLSSAVDLAQQFDALLCDVSQLVDGWKNVEPGAWSEWDQSVRDRITCMRGRLVVDVLGNAALTQQRDDLQSYKDRLPADWFKDSSLKTWFPITNMMLEDVTVQRDELLAANAKMRAMLVNARDFVHRRWRHLPDCPEVGSHANAVDIERCNCGLKVALADIDAAKASGSEG